jgi:hydroxymethylbilane synthase
LARWQAEEVARLLRLARPGLAVELVLVQTTGDRRHDLEVWELGGQGVFVKEVQAAVLHHRADVAVHSAKDLPSSTAPGLVLAAFPARADGRDALVGSRLTDLAPGAMVATGSVRRRAQLAWLRPDLTFTGLRGNVPTRIDRVPEGGAVVVAAAALERLGLSHRAAEILDVGIMLPQVAQGAIAVECRADDAAVIETLSSIDDPDVRVAVTAERAFLARLGGGCDLPVGAHARLDGAGGGMLEVDGMLASRDGRVMLRSSISGPGPTEATQLGARLAGELLKAGGHQLLDLAAVGEVDP